MATVLFLILISACDLFSHVVGINKFPNFNFPKRIFKEESRINSKAFDDVNCDLQLQLFSEAFTAREAWAVKLFDSWAKIDSGYLDGNQFNFGHFSECLKFKHDSQIDNEVVQGQYCLVGFVGMPSSITEDNPVNGVDLRGIGQFFHDNSLTTINGICVPSTCSNQKVVAFANSFLSQADLFAVGAQCKSNEKLKLETIDIVAISIYLFFALLLIASTMYDVIMTSNAAEANKLLIAFSVYTNGRKLFDVTKPNSKSSIDCLLGLRAISVLWIIFGHRFTNQTAFPTRNKLSVDSHNDHIYSVIVSGYSIAVDTFFVMGALLLTISTLNALDKKKLNIPRMIFHRYLRYTPVYAVLVLYMASLSKFTPSGPIELDEFADNCRKYWWSALIHLQNYINPDFMCLSHGWYLSVDFQLFVVSPLLIYPAWKYGRKFVCSLPALAAASSIYILIICFVFELKVVMTDDDKGDQFWRLIYCATQARVGPWLVGIVLGYVMHNVRDKKVEINNALNAILWILSFSTLTTVLVLGQPLNVPNANTSLVANAFYIAFHRLAWAIALSWIIFACQVLKTGGIVRWFLSWPEWQPIGRMSLSMYLVHIAYQLAMLTSQKSAIVFEIWPVLHLYWGDILVAIGLGTVLYLTFEAPILLVESYFYSLRHKKLSDTD